MNTPENTNESQDETVVAYERPAVVDHGSLAELTLAAGGNYTDGNGFGGGSA